MPAKNFTFDFKTRTEEFQDFDQEMELFILDGILDVIFGIFMHPALGVKFTLEEIVYHPVNSSAIAYYICAHEATKQILGVNEAKLNIVHPHSDDVNLSQNKLLS